MNLIRQEPWSMLNQLQQQFDRMLSDMPQGALSSGDDSSVVTSRWVPAVDIKEETDRFLIQADLPGMNPEDIEITMENGVLTLRGERRWEQEHNRDDYRRVERVRGAFYRRFALPETANAENIQAECRNGVLQVSIPKQEKAQPRRIQVAS